MILDVPQDHVGVEGVAEAVEDVPDLFAAEEVEDHERVGLLGDLVVVRILALGLEDAVEALEVAVFFPGSRPSRIP